MFIKANLQFGCVFNVEHIYVHIYVLANIRYIAVYCFSFFSNSGELLLEHLISVGCG